jgi:hypothetical protein
MNRLEEVHDNCSSLLELVAENFKPGAKITLVVRTPSNDEADFILTDEPDLNKVVDVLKRRKLI